MSDPGSGRKWRGELRLERLGEAVDGHAAAGRAPRTPGSRRDAPSPYSAALPISTTRRERRRTGPPPQEMRALGGIDAGSLTRIVVGKGAGQVEDHGRANAAPTRHDTAPLGDIAGIECPRGASPSVEAFTEHSRRPRPRAGGTTGGPDPRRHRSPAPSFGMPIPSRAASSGSARPRTRSRPVRPMSSQ